MDPKIERNIVLALKTLRQGRYAAAERILERAVDMLDAEREDMFLSGDPRITDELLRNWLRH